MAKNRNKGFSLVEIIISIAILTLLLTPIVKQLSNTMRINRLAKEQQYANDNAEYVVEYFAQNDLDTLKTVSLNELVSSDSFEPVVSKHDCSIYELNDDGSLTTDPVGSVVYTTTSYQLDDVTLGSRQTEYSRNVVLDDLALKIMSTPITVGTEDYSYRVAYNNSEDIAGFEKTNEGSYVQYTEDAGVKYVSGIVCKRLDDNFDKHGITNPNEVDVGNMNDLDSSKVAIISGSPTDYDEQALNELYTLVMESMRELDPKRYELELENEDPIRSFANTYISGNNAVKKLTEISVEDVPGKIIEGTKEYAGYYLVTAKVTYNVTLTVAKQDSSENVQYVENVDHIVYQQKFNYEQAGAECPPIYYEYQPFSYGYVYESDGSYSYDYIANDYLVLNNVNVDADEGTTENPVVPNKPNVKLYLYKPTWDASYSHINNASKKNEDMYNNAELISKSFRAYYVHNFPTDYDEGVDKNGDEMVNIYLRTKENSKPVMVYTNILYKKADDTYIVDKDTTYDGVDADDNILHSDASRYDTNNVVENQFVLSNHTGDFSNDLSTMYDGNVSEFPSEYLLTINDEKNQENRLFTITVTLEPVSENVNTIVLTGAKGEN